MTNVYLDRLQQQKPIVMTTKSDLIEEDIEGGLHCTYLHILVTKIYFFVPVF